MDAKQNFRLMSLEFDLTEEVAAVRAMATAETAGLIAERFLPGERIDQGHAGPDGRRLITLQAPQVVRLCSLTGKIRGTDQDYRITTEINSSLFSVVNGLMEDS